MNRPLVRGGIFLLIAVLLGMLLVVLAETDPHFSVTERWDRWLAIGTIVLLFANLLFVWWYAHSADRQMRATESQLGTAVVWRFQDNKPVVIIDREERTDGEHFVVRNVGGGFALNVFFVRFAPDARVAANHPLGALGAGEQRELPANIQFQVGDRYVVLAEGVRTRTRQWNATLNGISRGREMMHQLAGLPEVPIAEQLQTSQTIEEFLKDHSKDLNQQLGRLLH